MSEAPPEVVDELYAAPPDEFIARRDARAKELRKSDSAAADAVKNWSQIANREKHQAELQSETPPRSGD